MNNRVVTKWAVFLKKIKGTWAVFFFLVGNLTFKKIILKVKNGRKCKKLLAIS